MNDIIVAVIAIISLIYSFIIGLQKNKLAKKLEEKEHEELQQKLKAQRDASDRARAHYREIVDRYRGDGPEGNA